MKLKGTCYYSVGTKNNNRMEQENVMYHWVQNLGVHLNKWQDGLEESCKTLPPTYYETSNTYTLLYKR